MAVWRRWVFPILFVIVFGALAAALVKMAFFPDTATASADPGGQITEPVVPVVRQSVIDELTLEGTIARDDAVTVRSEVDGAVSEVHTGIFQVSHTRPAPGGGSTVLRSVFCEYCSLGKSAVRVVDVATDEKTVAGLRRV